MNSSDLKSIFNRTTPHPADPCVRLADRPDDVYAIDYPGVRAVIMRRDQTPQMADDLKRAAHSFPEDYRMVCAAMTYDMLWSQRGASMIPLSVRTQMIGDLRDIHGKVCSARMPVILSEKYRDAAAPAYGDRLNRLPPHIEKNCRLGFTGSYTADEGMTTLWFPGAWTAERVQNVREELAASTDPASVYNKYNAQHMEPGHWAVFKGDTDTTPEERFFHGAPLPANNTFRISVVS